jgi:hypothetical protein
LQKVKDLAEKVDISLKQRVHLEIDLMSMEHPRDLEELKAAVNWAEGFQNSIKFKLLLDQMGDKLISNSDECL